MTGLKHVSRVLALVLEGHELAVELTGGPGTLRVDLRVPRGSDPRAQAATSRSDRENHEQLET
jgi:hypothetical protein